jgi:hypothetical protein
MNKKKSIKNAISEAFKTGNFTVAFDGLLKLEHYEVADFLTKSKILEQQEESEYFWNEYCVQHCESVFSNKSSETILTWYLKDLNKTNEVLNELLTSKFPDKFIKAIKRNRAFLSKGFLKRIDKHNWHFKYGIELHAWAELKKAHQQLQDEITSAWETIKSEDVHKLLSVLTIWVESRFSSTEKAEEQESIRWVYNYALSFILSNKTIDEQPSTHEFDDLFIRSYYAPESIKIKAFIERIREWLVFETTILTSYCFDDNFEAVWKNERLAFDIVSAEMHQKWSEGTNRYLVNEKRYLMAVIDYFNRNQTTIPKGRREIDREINKDFLISQIRTSIILKDLQIVSVKFKNTIFFSRLVNDLNSYSKNRKKNYLIPVMTGVLSGKRWIDSYIYNLYLAELTGITNSPLAYIYEKKEEFIELFHQSTEGRIESELEDMISHFSFGYWQSRDFNPFNIQYSVLETPFVNLGSYIFTPMSLFGSNDWFYSVIQRGLRIYSNSWHKSELEKSSKEIEKFLAQEFEDKGFSATVISDKQSNQIDGDIDLFVNDGKTQILIQLKRTRLKLDLAADYKEMMEVDLKASGQINEAIKSIKEDASVGLEILDNHKKWIVTTSFERVLTEIDGCLKVNYFDLLWALRYLKFDSLDDLVKYVEEDRPFRDNLGYLNQL